MAEKNLLCCPGGDLGRGNKCLPKSITHIRATSPSLDLHVLFWIGVMMIT